MDQDIKKYIQKAQSKGLSDKEIQQNLLNAGWDKSSINEALGLEEDLIVPKPKTLNNNAEISQKSEYRHLSYPLNSILYIISFILLLISIYSGIVVSNNAIEYFMPKNIVLDSPTGYGSGISTSTEELYRTTTIAFAFLVISLPAYLGINAFLRSEESKRSIVRKSWARKISYFLIILNTFLFCIGAPVWLVWLIVTQDFATGDFLKFMINFSLNMLPLIYYFLQLRDDKKISA